MSTGDTTAPEGAQHQAELLAQVEAMLGCIPDGVLLYDAQGRIVRSNAAADAILGCGREEKETPAAERLAHGRHEWIAEDGTRVPVDELPAMRAARDGETHRSVVRMRGERGERWLLMSAAPLVTRGQRTGAVVVLSEITDRQRAEEALRESELRFRLLAEAMPHIVCVLSPDGAAEYVNPGWIAFSGLDLARTKRAGWQSVLHPEDLPAAVACRRRALKSLAPQDAELRYRGADGSFRWFLCRLAPVAEAGRVVRLVGSAMDVEDRIRAETEARSHAEALRAANERLREADRRKDEFLGMLSHELRNPLAPIRNALYILDHAAPTGEQARRAREIANRQIGHITRLVDDLLDVTRIARGKIELRRDDLDLGAVARRTADDYRAVMGERRLELAVEGPPGPVLVNGDETRLAQVFGNLLSNAAKFTPPGGRVRFSVRAEGERAVVHVSDTGAGISPEFLPTIFEPFTQGKQTLARSEGGLGLGLALVKGLVAMHGGDVAAVSGGATYGTDVIVTLPLARTRPPETRADRDGATGSPTASRRVLVIDDDRDAADTLAQLVELLGHAPVVAYDALDGLAKASEDRPDVVLCDIGLPGMDGYELARRFRASSSRRDVRLIALSGYAQPEDVAKAAEAGFDGHVAKPPDPQELAQLLEPTRP